MLEKMLIPLDGSKMAEVTLHYAVDLAGKLGLDVTLLHVCSPQEAQYLPVHEAYLDRQAGDLSRRLAETGPSRRASRVRGVVKTGNAADEIINHAQENQIDLIAIATHGLSGIKRWVLGSIAEKVLRASQSPVWLVRPRSEEDFDPDMGRTDRIIVPLDGSQLAEAILPHVNELAGRLANDIVLCQVVPEFYDVYTAGGRAARVPYSREHLEQLKTNARVYLQEAAAKLTVSGVAVSYEVRAGNAAEEIIKLESPHCVVAMSTHGRSGLERWAYGSVADKVLRGATSPVLLIRARQSSLEDRA